MPTIEHKLVPVPPPPGEAAWARLFSKLLEATEHHDAGLERPDAPEGFTAAEQSLSAVVEYLFSSSQMVPVSKHLQRLATALYDLERGARPALLAPRAVRGRAPAGLAKGHAVGFAARALDRLISAQEDPAQAARKVEKAFRTGHAIGWKNVNAKKIAKWRERCRAREIHDLPAGAAEKFHERLFVIEPPPEEEAKMLLQILSEAADRNLGE